MKVFKTFLIMVLTFAFAISTVNAAKATTTSKKVATSSESKKEEASTTSSKKSKINFYLFRRTGCPHCADELKYLDKIYNEYKNKINIIVYDTSDGSNSSLLEDVAIRLGVDPKGDNFGVPFTVVGEKTVIGFGEATGNKIKSLIDEAYENQVSDIVAEVIDDNVYSEKTESTDLFEAMKEEGLEITSKKEKKSNIVPIVVFGTIIICVGGLIYYSRKK